MAIVIRFVWPCQESTVDARRTPSGRSWRSVRRSTISVASSTAWLRVARTTISGSPDGSAESTTLLVRRVCRCRRSDAPRSRSRRRAAARAGRSTNAEQRQVDVGRLGVLEPVDLEQGRPSGGHRGPDVMRPAPASAGRRERAVARGGDAVELVPVAVERAPQRQLLGGRAPDGRQVDRARAVESLVRRSATRGTGCSRGRRATGSRSDRSAGAGRRRRRRRRSAPGPRRWRTGAAASCHASSTKQHVERPLPVGRRPEVLEQPGALAPYAELVRDAEDDRRALRDLPSLSSPR